MSDAKAPKISAVVITKNEEAKIADCLKSLAFADEILVVDSGSTDKTCAIAKEKGANVIFREWKSYYDQKNFANDQTTGEWIFSLDADERVSKNLQDEIIATVKNPTADVFAIPRLVYYINRWIRYSGWYPARKARLFRRDKGRWSEDNVHEKLVYSGKAKNLNGDIYHLSFDNVAAHIKTINNFTDIAAADSIAKGERVGWVSVALRPSATFIKMYVLKRGFLDGVSGFIIASLSAFHVFCKYVKIEESR